MLSSTFELFNQTNSINSFVAFIFCNLIIVILLVNNSSSKNSDNKLVPLSKTCVKNNCSILDKNNGLTHTIEATTNINLASRDNDNHNDDEMRGGEEEEEEEDELTRRVEEFIQKVNRCWKEEKLNA